MTFEEFASRNVGKDGRPVFHGHPRFYELLDEMSNLHSRKNHDYSGDDPLSNLKSSVEIGIPAWKGILIRLMDKWARLKTFAKKETLEVKDESIKDTLMDNAVYSLLCIIVYEDDPGGATRKGQ
ncbi:hypothetical protein LCGC14_1601590 [marine sediment metagenome]|uniref:Nucleotide modification associated domain-containing protein n=1 Tax=marine sediment metagenome TaxID=412755 RepID=A0A0F9LB29_9ZZZZ